MTNTLLMLAASGLCAGLLSGLLGIGGGIVLVPALGFILVGSVPPEHLMKACLATSLATIAFTSFFATWQQHRVGNADWTKVKQLCLGVAVGAVLGGMVATSMPNLALKILFAGFATYVSIQMWFSFQPKIPVTFSRKSAMVAGSITGAMSSWVGIGGGNILVPYLVSTGVGVKQAAGITSPVGVVVSIFATLGYAFSAWHTPIDTPGALGYIIISAFITIVATSFIGVYAGIRLTSYISAAKIKRIFAIILFFTGLKYWVSIFTA